MNKQILFTCFLLFSLFSYGQTSHNDQIEQLAEFQNNESFDFSELQEYYQYYSQNPININSNDVDRLVEIRLLNSIQLLEFKKHIVKNGPLISIEELQSITGFDKSTLYRIKPFVTIETTQSLDLKNILKSSHHQLTTRYEQTLEPEFGYNDTSAQRYSGSPQHFLARYRFYNQNNFSVGVTTEKDAGENFSNCMDFYSAHLFLKTNKFIKSIAVGDYYAGFGQGIIFNNGFSFGKNSDVLNIKQNNQALKPFVSTNEAQYLRGGGITLGNSKTELTLFYSNKNIDGNVTEIDSSENKPLVFSSISESGLHRTLAEINDRKNINEQISGAHLQYKDKNFEIGATTVYTLFDATYQKQSALYNQFLFNGKQLLNYGFNYSFNIRNMLAFGEIGFSDNGGYGFQNGLLIALDERLSVGIMHRNYSRNYQALKSNAFADGTAINNESGVYYSAQFKLNDIVSINAYCDLFKHNWFKYQVDGPSTGDDLFAQLTINPNKKTQYYLRARTRSKPENKIIDSHHYSVNNYKQNNIRFDASYSVTEKLKLHSRAEYVMVNKTKQSEGFLLLQDAIYSLSNKISFTLRYALFDSEDYDSKIYAYENDVPNYYYIPAFYDNGSRYYAMVHYQINRYVSLWLRFSQTMYADKHVIGTGASEINSSNKSDVKALVRFSF